MTSISTPQSDLEPTKYFWSCKVGKGEGKKTQGAIIQEWLKFSCPGDQYGQAEWIWHGMKETVSFINDSEHLITEKKHNLSI